ncbi:hypothetical protein HanIR_Chr15g0786611 [Helianthus annuus]|nr:hypothetical protein HanIR_Chr15g0786611 [Helianthus annuus]
MIGSQIEICVRLGVNSLRLRFSLLFLAIHNLALVLIHRLFSPQFKFAFLLVFFKPRFISPLVFV